MGETYSHPDHGKMEWYEFDGWRKQLEGWRCTECHVIAKPDEADSVFDEHDCDQYRDVMNGIAGKLP